MSYAVLHCSSDWNYFWNQKIFSAIPYDNLERSLPAFLAQQMQKQPFTHLLVINGPWWFSQLRIACLCVNILKMEFPELVVSSWNKIDLLSEFYSCWMLPDEHIMFVGMKKKVWKVNLSTQEYVTTLVSDISTEDIENSSMDMVENHLILECFPVLARRIIVYWTSEKGITLTYQNDVSTIWRNILFDVSRTIRYLTPDYMIKPSLG